jgi:hypothetical protein
MEFAAGYPRPPKPPKTFTRSELIRNYKEKGERQGRNPRTGEAI